MSSEANKALVRRFYAEAVDQGNLALIDTLFAADYAFYPSASSQPINREQFKQFLDLFRTAFAFHHVIEDQVAEGKKVATRWTVHGTHQGEFQGITATGQRLAYMGITIFHIADGKIVQGWTSFDELGMLRQLGVTPELAPPGD